MNRSSNPVTVSRLAFLRPLPVATFAFAGACSLALGGLSTPAKAAPKAQPTTLSFDVTARFTATSATKGAAAPQQTIDGRVYLNGERARVETTSAGRKSVMIYSPPYLYRLLPSAKAGVRWKVSSLPGKGNMPFDPQELLRNPAKIRSLLASYGAKRTGASTLNGTAVEVYQLTKPKGQIRSAKAWIRRSDALPVRLEAAVQGAKVAASWRNYARSKTSVASLFAPPAGYRIRDAKTAAPQMLF